MSDFRTDGSRFYRHGNDPAAAITGGGGSSAQFLPVKCYIGVGPSEFPETGSATTKRQPLTQEAVRLAGNALKDGTGGQYNRSTALTTTVSNPSAVVGLFSEGERSAVELALRFGVTLLKRQQMRYSVCRVLR